jgi:heat shock protein HspQ
VKLKKQQLVSDRKSRHSRDPKVKESVDVVSASKHQLYWRILKFFSEIAPR